MIIKMEEKPKEVVPPLSKTRMHFTSFLVVLSRIMVSILLSTSNSSTTLNTSNNTTITTSSTLITPSSINLQFSSQSQLHLKSKRNQKYQLLQSSAISLNSQLLSTKRGKLKLLLPFKMKKLKRKNQSLNKNELLKRKIPKKMRK